MSSVAIVVLNWNGLDDTRQCVESLYGQTYDKYSVILIENGSTELGTKECMAELQQTYPDLRVIYNERNLGFAGGVNMGIRHAIERDFDFVALFNNDAVADKNWLYELIAAQKEHSSGITTGLLLHADGKTIDSTGDWCSIWGLPFPRNRNNKRDEAPKSEPVFSGSGGASLYSTKMLREIGLFDEKFFAYYEDTDISFRAQLYDWGVYYTDAAIAYHKQGATSSKIPGFAVYQTFKNLPLFYIKNMPTRLLLSTGSRFALAYILMLGNAIKNGNGAPAVKGWIAQIPLFWLHAIPQRIKIQREKKVSASHIKSLLWPDLPPDQTGLRKFRQLFISKK